jgi:UDP-2,3-diacylglucosamine pyrophosphatase LpxH
MAAAVASAAATTTVKQSRHFPILAKLIFAFIKFNYFELLTRLRATATTRSSRNQFRVASLSIPRVMKTAAAENSHRCSVPGLCHQHPHTNSVNTAYRCERAGTREKYTSSAKTAATTRRVKVQCKHLEGTDIRSQY